MKTTKEKSILIIAPSLIAESISLKLTSLDNDLNISLDRNDPKVNPDLIIWNILNYESEDLIRLELIKIKEKWSESKILINITTNYNYQLCYIDIVDQGSGISLKYKEKIFERFYTDRAQFRNEHTGLGLSISRSIIESFDGSINLSKSSYPGFYGACFEIKLPLKDVKII